MRYDIHNRLSTLHYAFRVTISAGWATLNIPVFQIEVVARGTTNSISVPRRPEKGAQVPIWKVRVSNLGNLLYYLYLDKSQGRGQQPTTIDVGSPFKLNLNIIFSIDLATFKLKTQTEKKSKVKSEQKQVMSSFHAKDRYIHLETSQVSISKTSKSPLRIRTRTRTQQMETKSPK